MSSPPLGKIQQAILNWVAEGGYTYIGEGTTHHQAYGLGGRTYAEIERSVNALVDRGLLKRHKPGFYSLPDWERSSE